MVAQLFYMFMQKPWDNCALEASAGAAGVQLAAKGGWLGDLPFETPIFLGISHP